MEARADKRMLIIDVSFPRNVSLDVRDLEGVELYDIDGLRGVSEANILRRREEMKKAERIIIEELALLDRKLDEMEASRIVKMMFGKYSSIKDKEVRKAIARAKCGQDPIEKVMEEFGTALMGRFLACPTESLKAAARNGDDRFFEAARQMFELKEEEGDVPAEQDEKV